MIPAASAAPATTVRRPFYRHLYFQVLIAIALGAFIGHFWPTFGESLKPLGDAFIKLVKMVIAPVIFLTIVTGIAGMRDIGRVELGSQEYGTQGYFNGRRGVGIAIIQQPGSNALGTADAVLAELDRFVIDLLRDIALKHGGHGTFFL